MKIRIKGNSVRYRLTKSEVKTLCEKGIFKEATDFDGHQLVYAVELSDAVTQLEADFANNAIVLRVPKELAKDWYTNDRVGFENSIPTQKGTSLHLLLEKDFTCLDNTTEDQSDNYPNPKAILEP